MNRIIMLPGRNISECFLDDREAPVGAAIWEKFERRWERERSAFLILISPRCTS